MEKALRAAESPEEHEYIRKYSEFEPDKHSVQHLMSYLDDWQPPSQPGKKAASR